MNFSTISLTEFPNLSKPFHWPWGPIDGQFELLPNDLDESLIAHVRIIPFVADMSVVIRFDNGDWDHPGGTLEPGESYLDAIRRELSEEAGAVLHSFTPFGVFNCRSRRSKPYRPHLPHPSFIHLIGYAEVELTHKPTNPPDGETVVDVRLIKPSGARSLFANRSEDDGAWMAEMYELAARLRDNAE
ncbi:MAG: NUDIX domain-containing protein [Chloroflexi bacterium]|nr:NUDIX domain-containing protein [Chloroflexota bacterium]